jgi:poly(3-hydroxybutyrate) depolymerase
MRKALLATTFLTLATGAMAQTMQTASVNGMSYEVLLPANYDSSQSLPLVLFMSPLDLGNDPTDLNSEFVPQFQAMQAAHPSIVVIPLLDQSADYSGQTINYGGVTGSTQGEANAVAAVQQVEATFNINKSEVYTTGASMGGQRTDQIMVDHGPNSSSPIFAAGLSMAGTMINMTPQAAAVVLGNTPIIAVHGSADGTNLSGWDETMAQIDPNFQLTLVQGAGHNIWDGSTGYGNTSLWNELFSYTLNGTEPAVTLASASTPAAATPAAVPTASSAQSTPAVAATPASTEPASVSPTISTAAAQISPGKGTATDCSGNTYQITADGSVLENGNTWVPGGGGTQALTMSGCEVMGEGIGNQGWFTLSSDGGYWTTSAAPSATATAAPAAATPTAAAATAPTAGDPPAADPPAIAMTTSGCGALHQLAFGVLNGQIYAPNGQVFVPHGVNVGPNTMGAASPLVLQSLFPDINFVRFATGYQSSDLAGQEAYITSLTQAGIVAEIEDHPYPSPGVYSGAQLQAESAWYAQLAQYFVNNPYVWFGTMNEPSGGSSAGISDQELATYNAIRSTGSNAILMLELYGGGNPGTIGIPGGMSDADYASMSNVAWDLHFYGWSVNFSTDAGTISAAIAADVQQAQTITAAGGSTIPVIIGEFGNSTSGATVDPDGSQVVQAVLNSGYGYAAWTFGGSGGDIDNLTNGGGLTAYGQQVAVGIAALAAANPNGAAASGCAVTAATVGGVPVAAAPAATTTSTDPTVQGQITTAQAELAAAEAAATASATQ